MSSFDPDFGYDNPELNDQLSNEIEKCKKLIDDGNIYNSLETVEDVIQSCIDNSVY